MYKGTGYICTNWVVVRLALVEATWVEPILMCLKVCQIYVSSSTRGYYNIFTENRMSLSCLVAEI